MTSVARLKIPAREVRMKSFGIQVFKTTIFVLFTILLIAMIKVLFGGDPSLITPKTVINTLIMVIPISIATAVGIVLYERKKANGSNIKK